MLQKLAEQNHVHVTGNERTGSFSCRGVDGDYAFGEQAVRGKFGGHGVTGEFSFESGKAAVTISDKPFWLPEILLRRMIADRLEIVCNELTEGGNSHCGPNREVG